MGKKLTIIGIVAILIAAFFFFGLHNHFNLQTLQEKRGYLIDLYNQNPILIAGGFLLIYITFAALSLPAASILTLGAGAIFGFWTGLILVSFASTIGATLAFLIARYILRESMESSQLGMLAGTAVYVNAGTQIATLESISDIGSPKIIASFLVLAAFPFIAKFIMNKVRKPEDETTQTTETSN